jgi:hypothetical protein
MIYLLSNIIRKIPREKYRLFVTSLLVMVICLLLNTLDGVKARQLDDIEDVYDNFEVWAVVVNPMNSREDGLMISDRFIDAFMGPLSVYIRNMRMMRTVSVGSDGFFDVELIGITDVEADVMLSPEIGTYIVFREGYDDTVFSSNDMVAVISEDLYTAGYMPDNITVLSKRRVEETNEHGWSTGIIRPNEPVTASLEIVGVVYGRINNTIYAPFWTVAKWGEESDGFPTYTETARLLLYNRMIDDFKNQATPMFVPPGTPVEPDATGAMRMSLTVHDGSFNNVISGMRQIILIIDVMTPFIYLITAFVGLITGFIFTRRRMPEFAVIRSIGVSKSNVFLIALFEQLFFCVVGVSAGTLVYFVFSGGRFSLSNAVLIILCYCGGAAAASIKATGADILKLLRERE